MLFQKRIKNLSKAIPTKIMGLKDEKGSAMIFAVMILALLTMSGVSVVNTSNTEVQIASNHRVSIGAFYAAEAGIIEAKERLRGSSSDTNYVGDPGASYAPSWSAYLLSPHSWQPSTDDPLYEGSYQNYIPTSADHTNTAVTSNSLQTDISYLVRIRHKREYDAEQAGHTIAWNHYYDGDGSTATHTSASAGNIIYYGYGDPSQPTTAVQFTTAVATEFSPLEIIRAYGRSSDFQGSSLKIIVMEVVRNPGPVINSAVYAKGTVTGNGNSLSVDGNDNCGVAAAKPPIYTKSPAITNLNGSPTLSGSPASPQSGSDDIDINSYVNSLKSSATVTITSDQNGTNYGSSSNYLTCYSDTSNPNNVNGLKLQNVTGYGLLLVEGDLILGGGFNWNGIILVTGTLTFNGGGSGINILGAVLANQTVDINGGIDIKYDSCQVNNSLNASALEIVSWREVH